MKKYLLIAFYFLGSQTLGCADQNPRPVVPAPAAPVAPAPIASFVIPADPQRGTWASKSKAKRAEEARRQAERQHKQTHNIRQSNL